MTTLLAGEPRQTLWLRNSDGLPKSPATLRPTLQVASTTGTDVAMESAGVTLVKGDLRGIVRARALSRLTVV